MILFSGDTSSSSSSATKDDKDKYFWLLCTNKSQHDLDKLMLTQIVAGDALEELDKKLNNCGVKFRLANKLNNGGQKSSKQNGNLNGNNGSGTGSGDTGSSDNSNSGNGKGASLRDLIGSEQKVKMSDIIDACVEDSMEEMNKDNSNAKLTHFVRTTDLDEDRYVLNSLNNYILMGAWQQDELGHALHTLSSLFIRPGCSRLLEFEKKIVLVI